MADRQHADGQRSPRGSTRPSRRQFLERSSGAALAALVPARAIAQAPAGRAATPFSPQLLASADQLWTALEAMNHLGPRYTGNDAHRRYVDSLASDMQAAGLQVTRDTYRFPRFEARSWSLAATAKGGRRIDLPVTFHYPHSGATGPTGVTGPLAYVGKIVSNPGRNYEVLTRLGDLTGKIAVLDYELAARDYNEWYTAWGLTSDTTLSKYVSSVIAVESPLLTDFKKAGAAAVVMVWTNLSDGQATGQNMPFGRPLQEIPAVFVGRDAGAALRRLATEGATATVTLEADVFPDSPTDTVIATLPGATDDEAMIVTTHTDGPNAIQENAGVALIALARYFARVPRGSRRRTLVFPLTTGHDTGAYVPSVRGFIEQHPDIIRKSVASIAVEHLGCRAWLDDASMRYVATGKDELSYAITEHQPLARLVLETVAGTAEKRVAAVKPTPAGRYLGIGGALARTGLPTIGYYASPTYLNIVAPDGCISKLSRPLFHAQTTVIARLLHKMDAMSAAEIKGAASSSRAQGPAADEY